MFQPENKQAGPGLRLIAFRHMGLSALGHCPKHNDKGPSHDIPYRCKTRRYRRNRAIARRPPAGEVGGRDVFERCGLHQSDPRNASRLSRDGLLKFLVDFDEKSGGSRDALKALFSDTTAFNTALGLL